MQRSNSRPPWSNAIVGAAILLVSNACSNESERTFIDRSGVEYDLAFLLVTDEVGRLVTNTTPHRFEGDELLFGERPEIAVGETERVFLVAMDFEALAGASKAFSPERAHEIGVAFEEANDECLNGRLVDDDRRLRLPLPDTTRVFEANSAQGLLEAVAAAELPLLAATRLELPLADEGCPDSGLRFQPFFSDPDSITSHVGPVAAYALVRLDDDRVLMLTETRIVLLDRTSDVPARVLFVFLPFSGKSMRSPIGRPVVPGAPVPLFVVTQDARVWPETSIVGLDLEFDGVDQVSLTRTTTLGPGTITDLSVSPEGWVVVTTEGGPLYTRAPTEPTFTARSLPEGNALYSVLAVEGGRFLLGGEVGLLFEFDSTTEELQPIPIGHDLAVGLRLRTLAQPNGERGELWVAGSRGRTLRRGTNLDWESVDPAMPRSFQGCGRGDRHLCGGTVQLNAVEELLVLPRARKSEPLILSFITGCSAAIQLTGDEHCPGLLTFGDVPIAGLEATRLFVTDVLASRWVTVGDEKPSSMIYELDLASE